MGLAQIEKTKLRTWVELDKDAIKKNYQTFRKIVGKDCILMSVVKSNAYGHGLIEFTKEIVKLGVNFLGVDSFDEALKLREARIKTKILVLGYVSPSYFTLASEKNISITISNFTTLYALTKLNLKNKLNIHIKADSGLGRQGFLISDKEKVLKILSTLNKKIHVEGLYSHLAVGEDLKKKAYTLLQASKLNIWENNFKNYGYKPIKHLCATSSTMFFPKLHFDMVRVGIGMYGLWPSPETKKTVENKYKLYPVLSWKTIITEIKRLPKGARIGYDLTEELKRDSLLAIIPIGYWHGYPRILSGKGTFILNKKISKLVGRISMDMIVLDVTGVNAKVGDEVIIIGNDSGKQMSAEDIAKKVNTINYEIVTRINPQIRRVLR